MRRRSARWCCPTQCLQTLRLEGYAVCNTSRSGGKQPVCGVAKFTWRLQATGNTWLLPFDALHLLGRYSAQPTPQAPTEHIEGWGRRWGGRRRRGTANKAGGTDWQVMFPTAPHAAQPKGTRLHSVQASIPASTKQVLNLCFRLRNFRDFHVKLCTLEAAVRAEAGWG